MKNIETEPIANQLEKAQSFESRTARAKKLAAFIQAGMALPLLILVACGPSEQQKVDDLNSLAIYDLNGDGQISQQDSDLVIVRWVDFTGDGQVDQADRAVVKKQLGVKGVRNTTPARTPQDEFVPGELLIDFGKLPISKIAKIYEDNRLQGLSILEPFNQHHVRFASQEIDRLIEKLQNTPGIKLVGLNTLAELQEEAK